MLIPVDSKIDITFTSGFTFNSANDPICSNLKTSGLVDKTSLLPVTCSFANTKLTIT
jgi:hypothetical protein